MARRQRRLIIKSCLAELYTKQHAGISIVRIKSDHKLDISNSTLSNLIDWYALTIGNMPIVVKATIAESLFPDWLKDSPNVQLANANYKYVGTFPYGTWEVRD